MVYDIIGVLWHVALDIGRIVYFQLNKSGNAESSSSGMECVSTDRYVGFNYGYND